MSDCLINTLKWIVTEVLWPPVKPHFDYWWCFDGNVQGLRDEMGRLEGERRHLERKIEEARLRAESAATEVEKWSNEGTQKLEEATRILQGCVDLKRWKIIPRYSVGKSAKEIAKGIAKLREEGNSISIADPARPAAMVPISRTPILEFPSRKNTEEDIIKCLKDGNVRMIAICGAGGVGKTTMVRRIEDRVREEFDEVVTVFVSQQTDKNKIQKQIAEILRLGLSEETLDGRAHILRTRLMDSKKKLIIFDDVWKSFEPEDIGVPCGGCKIILTSRLKDVCEEMEADKIIEIQVLNKKEAWTLFREKSGDRVDDLYLRPIAEKVAAECKGLPIALATVGKALKNGRIETWRDALLQLRRANPTNFPQVLENVYKPLKLSYDFLETKTEKPLFLLCCLFPEDHNIRIEDLALLSFGLDMFERINNIEEGRNRTHNLLGRIRSRFLLMTGSHEQEVKMHDVVRDVAIFIGSEEGFLNVSSMELSSKDSSRNCNWMSVDSSIANAKLPVGLDFPNLRLLMILNSNYSEFPKGFDVNDICFKGMKELTVLYFSHQNFQSLPSSLEFLKKLRKLHLYSCKVKDISVVGKLASLEILRVWRCNKIEELPADFGELKFLRLLELRDCRKLKRIVAGVISSLVRLEELKIVDCFNKWEAKGNVSEERNASLSELESLRNLTSLEIDIFDPKLVAQEILLSEQLRIYRIRGYKNPFFLEGTKHERRITLHLPRDVTVGNWIHRLIKNTQSLKLSGDCSNDFNLCEIESLRKLVFQSCSTVKKLMNAIDWKFPMLEHLELRYLEKLEEIIDGTIPEGSNSFQHLESLAVERLPKLGYLWKSPNQNVSLVNLKSIDARRCPNLRYLFSMATARSLEQLQSLKISFCDTIEQVLWNEMESNTEASIIEFPKLKELTLLYLPNLLAFTQGAEIIKFPQLIELEIKNCPKLRIKIDQFPAGMIEKIVVSDCDNIEEIFRDDGNRHIIFQELYELDLSVLPYLTTFYRGVESIKFPKLKDLRIENLARLNSFVAIDSEPTHDHNSLHFFCNKKVEIIGLKTLNLRNMPDEISNMWCRRIPTSFFHNLERLYIYEVGGIRNLISSSIAKALVNLNSLRISYCKEMIDVVEDETQVTVNSIFPNLKYLDINDNYKLRSFCQWKHAFELPSLVRVRITDCPLMKTFTLGSLITPNLHRFNKNGEGIEMKDLNGDIHHYISTKVWVPISHASTLEFQSRKSMEEDIIKSLKDGNVRMIAICGAGGVGKTTMVRRIEDRVRKEFDEVVPVVVSQQTDKTKIQNQIAEILRLGLGEETLDGRAHKLRTRLMDSKKKLIIFDDVWKSFEPENIGVPYGGCKIILTSRLKDVCEEMEADKVIEIQVLDKKEAWTLFREKSGDHVDELYLRPIAEEVAAECKGLPIALATVGKALKNRSIGTWKDALLQLRGANPTNFPQVLKNVYMPLKLSYDFLETESEKSLFLLCCLFPEDDNIQIEDLALLSFGLGMFEGINNIEDGRNRTQHILERLRSRFLLMTGSHEQEVKMHDVVRDVAIFIGSKEKQGFLNVSSMDSSRNCNWMSVDSSIANAKLPVGLDFPNLRLLMILNSNYSEFPKGFDVNDICFKGMEELTVLYFSHQNFQSLPPFLEFLKKLRKLHLKNCKVKDISIVGELASLEILHVWRCNEIEELPADVGELKFLRLLELRDCEKLKRIVVGVISSLVGLEELKIVDCFDKWEAKGNVSEERNANLSELESLRNLTCLEIDIFDPNLVAQEILLSKQLRRYQIRGYEDEYFFGAFKAVMKHERRITLQLPRDVTVGNWIRRLVKNTQLLLLRGDGSNDFNLGEIESLWKLVFERCSTVEKLMNAIDWKFPMLEHLELRDLGELEEIIDGPIPEGFNSFQNLESLTVEDLPKLGYLWKSPNQNVSLVNLKSIYISSCDNLRYLFSMATARSLVQLQSLEILSCWTIEQVLWNEMESNTEASIIGFPKLLNLQLHNLPNLLAFTQGVEIIKFPQLIELEIVDCPNLRTKIDQCPPGMIEKIDVSGSDKSKTAQSSSFLCRG